MYMYMLLYFLFEPCGHLYYVGGGLRLVVKALTVCVNARLSIKCLHRICICIYIKLQCRYM